MKIEFRTALPEESEQLGDIAIESKGYWGYSREQLEIWRKDLKVEREYIRAHTVRTVWVDSALVGFFAIKKGKENALDHFWLLPEFIGKGIGAKAFEEIKRECQRIAVNEFSIISDPDAEGFYLHHGARRTGEVESIPQNRMLPKLRYTIIDRAGPATGDKAAPTQANACKRVMLSDHGASTIPR